MTEEELLKSMLEGHTQRMGAIQSESLGQMQRLNEEHLSHIRDPFKWFADRGVIPKKEEATPQVAAEPKKDG